jgi:hypothetical protein
LHTYEINRSVARCAALAATTAVDAGQQFHPVCSPTTAIMAHAGNENPSHHVAPAILGVRLVEHGRLATAVAFYAKDQDWKALNGRSRASVAVGKGSVPKERQWLAGSGRKPSRLACLKLPARAPLEDVPAHGGTLTL